MAFARFFLGLVVAVVVYALGQRIDSRFALGVDPFLITALYLGLRAGPLASAFGGSLVGLVHDALTGGLFGLHGFVDTAAAVLSNTIRQRFVIQQPVQVALVCFFGAAVQVTLLAFVQFALLGNPELPTPASSLVTMVTAGVGGAGIYMASGRAQAWAIRKRAHRRRRVRLGTTK